MQTPRPGDQTLTLCSQSEISNHHEFQTGAKITSTKYVHNVNDV